MERTLNRAAQVMDATLHGDGAQEFQGAVLDSRQVAAGDLFFALPGERTDGHEFVASALEAGAAAAVVEAKWFEKTPTGRRAGALLVVQDVMEALHALTREVRRTLPEQLVGITGSAGKTTTKEMLAALLSARYRTAANPGNLNNLLGFPVALLGIERDSQWMVAEMGMSTPRELARLSRLARPDAVVFTIVGAAHLESFSDLDDIAEAKAEILEGLAEGGLIVANADDPRVLRIARRHHRAHPSTRLVLYGVQSTPSETEKTVVAHDITADETGTGSRFILETPDGSQAVTVPLYGRHNVTNALAAAACAWALGVDLSSIASALEGLCPPAGRGEVHQLNRGIVLIDDAYNSNPPAAHSALAGAATLAEQKGCRRCWAILGDMLELGPTAPELHSEVGRQAAQLGFRVVGVGELGAWIARAARDAGAETREMPDAVTVAKFLPGQLEHGDLVLVKASRGVGLDLVVDALTTKLEGAA